MNSENLNHLRERRQHSRYPCHLKDSRDGVINNISLSGLRYETNQSFDKNDPIEIIIQSPNGTTPLSILGEVVRRDLKSALKKCAYGVRFKNNSYELTQQIKALIKQEGERQLSLIGISAYHHHRLSRYSVQFLEGIPTEVSLTHNKKMSKGRLIDFNRFGVRFFLEGESSIQNEEIIEDLKIYFDSRKIYEGKAQIRNASPSKEVTEYGAIVLDSSIDIDMAIIAREKFLFGQTDIAFQDTVTNIKLLERDFKIKVSDLRYLLDSIKERLEKEQEKIDHIYSQEYQQLLLQERLESASLSFKKEIHDLIMGIDQQVRKLPKEAEDFAKLYYHRCLNVYYKDSKYARRAITKPLGYAGDYEIMNIVYNDIDAGKTLWEKFMSRMLATVPPAQAVRNRADYLFGELKRLDHLSNTNIMSLACGPSKEVQMYLEDPLTKKNGRTFLLLRIH